MKKVYENVALQVQRPLKTSYQEEWGNRDIRVYLDGKNITRLTRRCDAAEGWACVNFDPVRCNPDGNIAEKKVYGYIVIENSQNEYR